MEFTTEVQDMLLQAENKALATNGPHGLNVVPVSSVRVEDGNIWLVNYFMNKTHENILADSEVALTFWSGLTGYQVKGQVNYHEAGEFFDTVTEWIADTTPDRVVKGVLVIEPEEIHEISL